MKALNIIVQTMFIVCLHQMALPAADQPSALVRRESMTQQTLPETVIAYGIVEVDPSNVTNMNFYRPGHISRLYVTSGQLVKSGSPLFDFTVDPAELSSFYQDQAAEELAKTELNRVKRLLELHLATPAQYGIAENALINAQAKVRVSRQQGGGNAVEQVKAPCDGLVLNVTASQGDHIQAGTNILQLACPGTLRARLALDPARSTRAKANMPVWLSALFRPDEALNAQVSEVLGRINPDSQMVDIIVNLPKQKPADWIPGLHVRGEVVVSERTGWTVPDRAVLRDQRGSYIFQIVNERAVRVTVTTGLSYKGQVQVSGEFDPKLPVVTLGNYELQDAMPVREE